MVVLFLLACVTERADAPPRAGAARVDAPVVVATVHPSRDREELGAAVAVGDVDGDGVDEVVASSALRFGGPRASTFLVFEPASGDVRDRDAATVVFGVPGDGDARSLALVDLDHDGIADLFAATADDTSHAVITGLAGPLSGVADVSTATWRYRTSGEAAAGGAQPGDVMALGDIDGDGFGDLGAVDGPGSYVLVGAEPRTGALGDGAWWTLEGATIGVVGDLDGDGRADVAARSRDSRPALAVFTALQGGVTSLSAADAWLVTDDGAMSPGPVGDLDGDGLDDLLVTQGYDDVLRYSGGISGDLAAKGPNATVRADVAGPWLVAAAGDVDGDGRADAVGATKAYGATSTSDGLGDGRLWLIDAPGPDRLRLRRVVDGARGQQLGLAVAAGDGRVVTSYAVDMTDDLSDGGGLLVLDW